MSNVRRNSLIAVALIVILRLAIGWHLLYEGLWKLDTQETANPWTAAGYLKNAEGPLRDTFRDVAGDPDDIDWLNYDVVAARWDDWAKRFAAHYALNDKQQDSLQKLLDGNRIYVGELEQLPDGIDDLNAASRVSKKVVWYDTEKKRLTVDGKMLLKPDERNRLLKLVANQDDELSKAFREAVVVVDKRQKSGIGYKQKLAAAVKGNPDLVGNSDWQRVGEKEQYKVELARYEELRDKADTDFQWDHLNSDWKKIQSLRAEITGPVKALESELHDEAVKKLNLNQMSVGPPSEPWTMLRITDTATMWGLTILGLLLISGLFTRFAAVAAAFMLFNFYMAMPPFPGVPESPGPEHAFIVNKNLIEVFALLAIAALPTGLWFGIDNWLFGEKKA